MSTTELGLGWGMNGKIPLKIYGLYEGIVMPFRITNAPKHFYEINEPCLERIFKQICCGVFWWCLNL